MTMVKQERKEYEIIVSDYELDEEGIVIDRDGGILSFNDAGDFIMMWNYFKGCGPAKDITEETTDYGKYLIMSPKEIGRYVTDYQITGEAYKVWKEWEEKQKDL